MNSYRKDSLLPLLKAKDILNRLQIREPSEIQIMDIAMERGVFVKKGFLEGSEARLIRRGEVGIITVNSSIPEEGRTRFAIAHELGHFELHTASQFMFCTKEDMYIWNENKIQEIEANEFASCILMPEDIFVRYFKSEQPNMDMVKDLAGRFRTTLTATALRYVTLSSESCAVAITKDGIVKWYRKSSSFNFHIKVGEKLSPSTDALEFNKELILPPHPIRVPASAWLVGKFDDEAMIFEHSFLLGSYGILLSLLWISDTLRPAYRRLDEDEPEFDLTNPFTPDGKRWRW